MRAKPPATLNEYNSWLSWQKSMAGFELDKARQILLRAGVITKKQAETIAAKIVKRLK